MGLYWAEYTAVKGVLVRNQDMDRISFQNAITGEK